MVPPHVLNAHVPNALYRRITDSTEAYVQAMGLQRVVWVIPGEAGFNSAPVASACFSFSRLGGALNPHFRAAGGAQPKLGLLGVHILG